MEKDNPGKNIRPKREHPREPSANDIESSRSSGGTMHEDQPFPEPEGIFYQIFHRNPACMGIVSTEGEVLEVNQSLLDVYGYTREELIGRTAAELDLWILPEAGKLLEEFLAKGSLKDYEASARDKPGEIRKSIVSLESITFRGRPSILAMFFDITDLKSTQEALRIANEELEAKVQERTEILRHTARELEEQKEVLQKVFDNIPAMLVFYDSSRNTRYINRELERLTGWPLEEVKKNGSPRSQLP